MDIKLLLNLFMKLAEEKLLDVDISTETFILGLRLLSKYAPKLDSSTFKLSKEIKNNPGDLILNIVIKIAEDYDEEKMKHSELSKETFAWISKVTKTKRDLEKIQLLELLAIADKLGDKVKELTQPVENKKEDEDSAFLETTTLENTAK